MKDAGEESAGPLGEKEDVEEGVKVEGKKAKRKRENTQAEKK
jgi:hypothetical protein